MTTKELKNIAKGQGVKITNKEARLWIQILDIVENTTRINTRIEQLGGKGFGVASRPMKTGFGVGYCVKRMNNGLLRIRISANWAANFGNYALCVQI